MYKLIRLYNRNRKKILIFVLIIAFFFLILRVLDTFEKNKTNKVLTTNTISEQKNVSNSVVSSKSLVSGVELDSKTIEKNTKIIEEFIEYCKKDDIDKAYNLISRSCKEQLYPTKDTFKDNYIFAMFQNKNFLYTIENWYNNTYKINITENILSTGKEANYSKQDYITVIEDDDEKKININNFIEEIKINSEYEIKKVKIKIESQYQYMDYTIFTLEIYNGNDTSISLDNFEDINNIYCMDTNNSKYYAYTHEISKEQLEILPRSTKKLKIKFYSKNILTKTINKIAFKNVILNYGISGYEKKTEYIIKFRN